MAHIITRCGLQTLSFKYLFIYAKVRRCCLISLKPKVSVFRGYCSPHYSVRTDCNLVLHGPSLNIYSPAENINSGSAHAHIFSSHLTLAQTWLF